MPSNKNKDGDLKKISSSPFSRGVALFNLTLSSSAKFAGHKIKEIFTEKEKRQENFNSFLSSQAMAIAQELGNLKGSIMKAGQLLSVYGEHFLPPEANHFLKSLQSESRPVVWEEMKVVLEKQLGDKLLDLEINSIPIAAASMGQVYQAFHKKLDMVLAIKVQYPGVDKAIDSDLQALKKILSLSQLIPKGPSFEEIFKEIKMMLHYETDYQREMELIKNYQEQLSHDPRFIVPKVFPELSTKRVLTMSFENGTAVDDPMITALSQERRNKLGASILDLMFLEIFQWKTVQTDPHFGNYKIKLSQNHKKPDQWILYDFGAVRHFPKRYIYPFAQLVKASIEDDVEEIIKSGMRLGFINEEDPEEVFKLFADICLKAIEGFTEEYESPSLDGTEAGANPYHWGQTDLMKALTKLAKDAIFTFKLRTPPREAIFLDRKMVGIFTLIAHLELKMGPRKLILKHLDKCLEDK